jgi:hypothetical protein
MVCITLTAAVRRALLLGPFLSISLLSASASLQAQEVGDDGSTVIYTADYFAQWSPVTAQDMMNRIPGMSSGGGGGGPGGGFSGGGGGPGGGAGGRGLGGGGGDQILIDGKRVAGKSNEANSQLSRISADKVLRIELIRGTATDLDVRADQIVNIVLSEALSNRSYSYEANTDLNDDGRLQPGGKFAVNGQYGGLNYLLSAEMEPRNSYQTSFETSVLGDFSPNDTISEERTRDQYTYTTTANLGYEINLDSSVRLNLLYGSADNENEVFRDITNLRVTPNPVEREREDNPGKNRNWEIGGDYELRLANNHLFKALFILNERDDDNTRERFDIATNGNWSKDLFLNSHSITSEEIVRASYSLPLASGQGVEFGAERAVTTLDSALRLGLRSTGGIASGLHGGLTPQSVSNAVSTVEEVRYEPFVVHNWQLSPRLSLESSMLYELSEITQTGDVFKQRDFNFLKPKADLRFEMRPGLQLRGTVYKTIRQLSFSDFVASSDDRDNDAQTMAGNTNLVQEQVWYADFSTEYRLPQDMGVVDATLSWMKHIDVIERIDVTPPGGSPQSANGNIGDGTMLVFRGNASVRLTQFNMPNLMLISSLEIKDSEIVDPFLGTNRRFQYFDRGRFQMGFRHDIPSARITYGANWNNRFDGNMKRYDVNNIERNEGDPNVSLYAEYVTAQNVRIRFDVRSLTNGNQCRERTRYANKISNSAITEIESYCGTMHRVMSIKINGTF